MKNAVRLLCIAIAALAFGCNPIGSPPPVEDATPHKLGAGPPLYGPTTTAFAQSVALASDHATVPVLTPDRTTFTLAYLQGTLGGAALATDSDPNTVDPGVKGIRIGRDMIPVNLGAASVIGSIADASGSLAVQPWVYDDVRAKWWKFVGAPVTVGTVSTIATVGGGMTGAKFFMQITSNGSAITQYWWFVR